MNKNKSTGKARSQSKTFATKAIIKSNPALHGGEEMRIDKKYAVFAVILFLVAFSASVYFYPEWKESWFLLIVAAVVGVVGFIANFRQAFELKKEKLDTITREEYDVTPIYPRIDNPFIGNPHVNNLLGSAPPRPSLIVGRDNDIDELKNRLKVVTEGKISLQVITAIKGWPGVGKTTIASALAYDSDIAELFPDGVLWTSLGQEPNILSAMAVWGCALGTRKILKAQSVEEAQNQIANLLYNKRMLLIIDDVWKAEDAFPFKVGGVGCATLITTRLNVIANTLAPTADNIFRLEVLKDEDALELLKQLAPSVVKQYPNECLVLVQELGGLPLALQVAGRLLNIEAEYGFGVIDLIEDLREGEKLLSAIAPADRTDLVAETTPTVASLLQKSLDRLDQTTRDCYAFLGLFAPKPATFDIEAMKYIWKIEDPNPIIKVLIDRGLLEFVPELNRYQMHTLLVMLAKTLIVDD